MPADQRPADAVTRGLVLVVEDEPAIADVLRLNLRAAGYGVEVVGDGAVALERVRRLRPSAVVLDPATARRAPWWSASA